MSVTANQDGLGTDSFPEDTFWPVHNFIIQTLESEGIHFSKQHIDRHFPEDNSPMRKPGTGMLTEYIDNPAYDMANSYVIGDRETDAQLAKNLGCKSLILGKDGMDWDKIAEILFAGDRIAEVKRTTKETDIYIKVNFLEQWPLKCVNGTPYTLDGPVEDESEIKGVNKMHTDKTSAIVITHYERLLDRFMASLNMEKVPLISA